MSWDNYFGKHCARLYGWLPASKVFKAKNKNKKLKYLTLCDTNAIDIFMLEQEGILTRNKNGFLTDIIICEQDESKISEIFQVVRPPLRESIIKGKIQKLLLFEDSEKLQNIDPEEDIRNRDLRMQLNLRRDALKLQTNFPFDIINFDPYDSLLNPEREIYRAFSKIFQFQEANSFLLFLTTPISDDTRIVNLFNQNFKENIEEYGIIKETCLEVLDTDVYSQIPDKKKRIAIGIAKAVIAKTAIEYDWKCSNHGIYVYENDQGNFILSAVCEFNKGTKDVTGWYPQEIIRVIKDMPSFYSFEEASKDEKVKEHLKSVRERREAIQNEFSTKPD